MTTMAGPDATLWIEMLVSLALGVGVVVGLAALASRAASAAQTRRTIWQACVLGLVALTAFEITGVAPVVVQGLRDRDQDVEAPLVPVADENERGPVVTVLPVSPSPASGDVTVPPDLIPPSPEELREVGADALLVPSPLKHLVGRTATAASTAASHESLEPAAGRAPAGFWWPGALWLVGASLICGRSLFARLLLARTRRRLDDVDDPALGRRTRALAGRLGVLAAVNLKQSDGLGAPITFGLFKPTVVLPPHFDAEYTESEQDVVLAHELAHIANRDALWQLISECSCALLWWHPFSWYARQRLQVESEFAADEATTLIHRGPETLAECLVELATRLARRPRLGLLSVRGRGFRSSLGRRVERLVRLESSARPPRPGPGQHHASRFAALACSLAIVATITLSTAWARTPRSQTGDLDMDTTRTPGIWQRSVAGFVFASLFTLSDGDASAQNTPTQPAESAPGSEKDSVQDDLVGDVPTKDTDAKKKQSKSSKIITKLIRRAQDQALDSNDAPRKKESKPARPVVALDSLLDDASTAKKKTRKNRIRSAGLVEEIADETTAEPRVTKRTTRTRLGPRPVADPEALDDSEAKPKPRTPRTPGVSLFPVKPRRSAVPADWPELQPAPLVSTPPGAMTALSPHSAIYDRGTGLFLDLVNLATALTDARGEVELQRLDTTRYSELTGQNLVSEHEFLKAKILLETAQRKTDILKRMAETALRSSTNLLNQLHEEYKLEAQRFRVGAATQAGLASISTRLAAAEGNVDILKTLLSSRPRKTAGRTSRRSGRLGATLQRIPTSLRIGIDKNGKLTLDGKGTDLERLSSTLQALVPSDARAACNIRLELESSCPLQKVTAVLARLENLKFSKVNLTAQQGSTSRTQPRIRTR